MCLNILFLFLFGSTFPIGGVNFRGVHSSTRIVLFGHPSMQFSQQTFFNFGVLRFIGEVIHLPWIFIDELKFLGWAVLILFI